MLRERIGILPSNQRVVSTLPGIWFDEIINNLRNISSEYRRPIIIQNGIISQPVIDSQFYVYLDFNGILDPKKQSDSSMLSLSWWIDQQNFSELKKMKQQNEILITKNEEQSTYLVTDGHQSATIDAYDGALEPAPVELENRLIGSGIYDISLKKIKQYMGTSKEIDLHLFDSQLEQIRVSRRSPFTFNTSYIMRLQSKKPDQTLKASYFPRVAGTDNFVMKVARDDHGVFWLLTESTPSSGVTARTFERLE